MECAMVFNIFKVATAIVGLRRELSVARDKRGGCPEKFNPKYGGI